MFGIPFYSIRIRMFDPDSKYRQRQTNPYDSKGVFTQYSSFKNLFYALFFMRFTEDNDILKKYCI